VVFWVIRLETSITLFPPVAGTVAVATAELAEPAELVAVTCAA
jgi:hypothetical protein